MKKFLIKSCTAIILIVAIIMSTCSCAVQGVIDTVSEDTGIAQISNIEKVEADETDDPLAPTDKETAVSQIMSSEFFDGFYFFGNMGTSTSSKEEKAENKDVETQIEDDEVIEAPAVNVPIINESIVEELEAEEPVVEEIPKEELDMSWETTPEQLQQIKLQNAYILATDCIAYDIYAAGYEVFRAIAQTSDGKCVFGLGFTRYDLFAEENGQKIYYCGFVQLLEDNDEIIVTASEMEKGVAVIPYGEYDTTMGFLLSLNVSLPSYSGIAYDNYFKYVQSGDFAVQIFVCANDREAWDEEVSLFDFTKNKYVFKADLTYSSQSASPYFSDEHKARKLVEDAIEKLLLEQESNSYKAEQQALIIYCEKPVDEYITNSQSGLINSYSIDELKSLNLSESEMVIITPDKAYVAMTPEAEQAAIESRRYSGIVGLITGILIVVGSVALAVASYGTTTPVAITAIMTVTGAGATLYGMSEIAQNTQEILYANMGNISTDSINPGVEIFKNLFALEEDEAERIYNIWGMVNIAAQAIVAPAGAALNAVNSARAAGTVVTVWQTLGTIVRTYAVDAVIGAISGVAALGVKEGTTVLVTNISGDAHAGEIWGFIAGVGAGIATGFGLSRLDAKYDFSGLKKWQLKPSTTDANRYTTDNGRSQTCQDWTRDDYLNNIDNPKLKETADYLYRDGAEFGDGGTADAVRYTKQTGELVGGSNHIQKATDTVTHLESLMKSQDLSYHDMKIAKSLMDDLIHALRFIP